MEDSGIHRHIERLVAEEHELLSAGDRESGLDAQQHARLEQVRVELDRYWDLLRQRRAQREFGLDPDDASLRSGETVEGYEG